MSKDAILSFFWEVYGLRKIEEITQNRMTSDIPEFLDGTIIGTFDQSHPFEVGGFPWVSQIKCIKDDDARVVRKDLDFHIYNTSYFENWDHRQVGNFLEENVEEYFPGHYVNSIVYRNADPHVYVAGTCTQTLDSHDFGITAVVHSKTKFTKFFVDFKLPQDKVDKISRIIRCYAGYVNQLKDSNQLACR